MSEALILSILDTFVQAAPYLLLGILFSAILHVCVDQEKINTHLGKPNFKSVLWAACAGVPLPLCSCGVIPMAAQLRKQGASRGAVISFLISTPETGVDSIALSFALLDPVMAVFRPIAAFISAILAGIVENIFDRSAPITPKEVAHQHDHCHHPKQKNIFMRLGNSFYETAVVLLGDIGLWMLFGIVLAGIIAYFVPTSFIEQWLSGGLGSMLCVLIFALPLYICASASTPIAATLILKGMSPGTALVFLIAGPATNVTTMIIVWRTMGMRALIIYLSAIIVCAIGFGLLLDQIFLFLDYDPRQIIMQAQEHIGPYSYLAASLLAILMAFALWRKYIN